MEKINFVKHGDHPTAMEEEFLSILYLRFTEVRDVIVDENFMNNSPTVRLFHIKELLSIYTECLKYPPIKAFVDSGDFSLISIPLMLGLFKNLRNILSHFPLASAWSEIQFKKSWLTVFEKNSRIEKFLSEFAGVGCDLTMNNPYTVKPLLVRIGVPIEFNSDILIPLNAIINEAQGSLAISIISSLVIGKQLIENDMPFDKSKNSLSVKKII